MEIIAIHSLAKEMLLTKSYKKIMEYAKELMNIEKQIKEIRDVYESIEDYDTQLALYNKVCNLADRSQILIEESDNLRRVISSLKKMRTP